MGMSTGTLEYWGMGVSPVRSAVKAVDLGRRNRHLSSSMDKSSNKLRTT